MAPFGVAPAHAAEDKHGVDAKVPLDERTSARHVVPLISQQLVGFCLGVDHSTPPVPCMR